MQKLGYCCINKTLEIGTKTITLTRYNKLDNIDKFQKLQSITRQNFSNLLTVLKWNVQHNIFMFRVGSDIVPLATIKDKEYDYLQDDVILSISQDIVNFCYKHNIRLTIHPSQFLVINSFSENVFNNSLNDLIYHHNLCELLNISNINIHVGGVYGDINKALQNFISNFQKIPKEYTKYLAIENDDKSYNVENTLWLCQQLNLPMIVDLHHDRVLSSSNTIDCYIDDIVATWENNNRPLCHFSSSASVDKIISKHHDNILVDDYSKYMFIVGDKFDIEFECKNKELSLLEYSN